jgi:fumarylacetoacetate (FAA) hydrolase family protein
VTDPIVPEGVLVGRARIPGFAYPRVVTVRDGALVDITSATAPTVRDVAEMDDPARYVAGAAGQAVRPVQDVLDNSWSAAGDAGVPSLLSPIDLQAVKAAGVTFVVSLLERVIEEQARGDKTRAYTLRRVLLGNIGTYLSQIEPG